MAAVGSHFTLFLLTSSQDDTTQTSLSVIDILETLMCCLKKYTKVFQSHQTTLTNSLAYLAVLLDERLEKTLQNHCGNSTYERENFNFGKWHLLRACSSGHQTPKRKKQSLPNHKGDDKGNLSPLKSMIDALDSYLIQQLIANGNRDDDNSMTSSPSKSLAHMATRIHTLMDRALKKADEYVLVDVFWIGGEPVPSPQLSVELFGTLLRLKKWHNAHIEFITTSVNSGKDQQVLCEWEEVVGVDRICRLSEWSPLVGLLWRGVMNFTEHKHLKQAFNHSSTFPGFTLSLCPDIDLPPNVTSVEDILTAVGFNPKFCPSHLEMMQSIRVSTVPLFWISPLHCKLSLSSTNCSSSKDMFQCLFGNKKDLGFLVCLCQSEDDEKKKTTTGDHHGTTVDWIEYVQGKEEEDVMQHERQLSPLSVYETGPMLLLTQDDSVTTPDQSDYTQMSCDAWFLWKPDAIDTGIFAQLKNENMQFNQEEEDDGELSLPLMKLPILNFEEKLATNFSKLNLQPASRRDFHHFFSQLSHELELPPAEWPEIKALKTHEWIQRKMIRRLTTPDLMFGRMVAPPPTSITTQMDRATISDVLSCFTDHGMPAATSELSPIAMNDPGKLTRVHVPVEVDDVTYSTIISTTPSSKKQYHGVNYCLTAEDTSLDVRLTKIQQRCLISERSSHCSTVVTPKAERDRQQSRRMKAARSRTTGKKKEDQSGETAAAEKGENGSTSIQERTEAVSNSASVVTSSTGHKLTPKKRTVSKPPRTAQYKSGPIKKLMKSPVVKIPRSRSQWRPTHTNASRNNNDSSSSKEIHEDARSREALNQTTNKTSGSVSPHQADTSGAGIHVERTCTVVQDVMDDTNLPEASPVKDQPSYATMTFEKQDQHPVVSEDQQVIVEANQTLRRSPRLKKRQCSESGKGSKLKSSSDQRRSREKNLKAQLGQEVVKALKKHDMPRTHPCFRRCYARLFKLSKSFLQDLKDYAKPKGRDMREEIERVVQHNAPQVIEFECKINQNTS